jgi:hypothetical protein
VKGFEGSLLKVNNKNGKNLSVSSSLNSVYMKITILYKLISLFQTTWQPVGFVTFASRVDAELAKKELTVIKLIQ